MGRSDWRPIVRLSADTIVRWAYRPNHTHYSPKTVNLFNNYLLLVTFETNDNYSIRFKITNNSCDIRFNSK